MELIKITEQANGSQAVSAKELHAFLEIETRFDKWINRMFEYGFDQNIDYQRLDKIGQTPNGGSKQILDDYALTLDTAKEIAMIQRSEKGKQARQYFIDCEKQLKAQQSKLSSSIDLSNPDTVLLLVQNWKKAEEEKQQLLIQTQAQSAELEKQAPKIKYIDKVLQSTSTYYATQIAKELGMTARKLNKLLYEKGVQYRFGSSWVLYSKHDNKGYTKTKTVVFTDASGNERTTWSTVWTEYGRAFIHHLFKAELQ